ncbi:MULTISPECIES: CheR family methyltransferase [Ramlibacter]|uniref:histidine kinase n=1 Tax=Ramlibacter pinisoli TaxID=2682844 RepID=A0A6N8IWI4_9BURK|nr:MULTISPECIES: CheR family methyltransferase [Ramlibacter]MBA2965494.1 PAS domain S-box protein [Ramlibacter sp. CGMCC 1.13660]MVQ30460.1 PAS domain S-box protein [Ramlibacter pinisoli]
MVDATAPDPTQQEVSPRLDDAVPTHGYAMVPLVALGGGTAALPSLPVFFQGIPGDTGLAFVVAIQIDPSQEPQLLDVLHGATEMPVLLLSGRETVRANHVYVVPAQKVLRAEGEALVPADMRAEQVRHATADLLFRVAADSRGAHAAAIVLAGLDGDGAIGIKRIKERGGLTIAQDPDECRDDSMPRTAIGTGMVDWTLPVAEMAGRLLAYFRLEPRLHLPSEIGSESVPAAARDSQEEAGLHDVLAFLRTRTGRDFNGYKRATIVRRIARRMQVNDTASMADYLGCLRTRPGEAGALLQDLLISVTNFFRDPDYFKALEPQLSALVRSKASTEVVRVWVPACATGEEAYSLAILLSETARQLDAPPLIQVFATDLDEAAIRACRDGVYPAAIEADVPQDWLRRYFIREHRGYRVRREVREMVLFAQHDVLKDSPFSRLDLVSCRNLLIYLSKSAQQRLFQTFHFALRPQGLLFLGSSETCDEADNLFTIADKKHRIYLQRPAGRMVVVPPSGASALKQALQLRAAAEVVPPLGGRAIEASAAPARPQRADDRLLAPGALHLRLLETLAPPSILVDKEHDILHLSPGAARYLQYAGGEPSRNLLRAVLPDLRIEVRAALSQAGATRQVAEVQGPCVTVDGQHAAVRVRVHPLPDVGADLLFMVLLEPVPVAGQEPAPRPEPAPQDQLASHLDREVERLKAQLRETVEQYETSTEELKASNEELQAMNEELRSATEELETGREELQSINEELSTVNQELESNVDELAHTNSDIQNLMDATAIATVFLDRNLQIMRYTPMAVRLFSLIPSDVGRPLGDLATRLDYPDLSDDARRVLERLAPIEREIGLADGTWFLTRLLPYRTVDDRIAGVVLSFIDITERKQAEEVRMWLSAVVGSVNDAIISFALDRTILSWNAAAEAMFGYTAEESIGQLLDLLVQDGDDDGSPQRIVASIVAGQPVTQLEVQRRRKDGQPVFISLSAAPIRDGGGAVIGGTAIARDITASRAAAEALRLSEERLRLIVESAREYAIFATDLERNVTHWNTGAERLLGYSGSEMLGRSADIVFTAEDRAAGAPEDEARRALADGRASDDRVHVRKDGGQFWADGVAMPMHDQQGRPIGFVKVLRDQTEARETQQALQRSQAELVQSLQETQAARRALEEADVAKDRFLAVLSHELRNPLASIASASELLLMTGLPEAARGKAAEVVQRQARAMKVLLDELLDVSRLALGRLSLSRRRISLTLVIQNALEASRPLVQAAAHELVVSLPPESVEVDADPVRLAQVVSNLVGNSAKYTPEGGRIEVSAEVFHDEVVITVSDNGIGMEPAEIDRMFDLFSQGERSMSRSNGGLGIGLALARNIVELHGGWIMASSAGTGRGCQMRVGLPLVPGTGEPAPPAVLVPQPQPQPVVAAAAAEGDLILVADDNGDAAWGMAKLLELSGFRALLARSGEEALRLAQEQRPAVALLDIGMPDLSGHDVARRVRAEPWGQQMILIAATGWGQEEDVRQSMAAGFDAHLTKPLNVGRVKSLVEEISARRGR